MSNKLSNEIESLCFLVLKNLKEQDGQGEQGGQKKQDGQKVQNDQRIPLWPYVVAVTGHRSFAKPGEVEGSPGYERETIKNAFKKELEQMALLWKKSCNKKSWLCKYKDVNAPFILLTGMADGADQLAAEAALELPVDLNVKVVAVLPMEEELFKRTVKDKEKFKSLIDQVYLKYELPLLNTSKSYRDKIADVDNRQYDKLREKQYKFLGKFLALHCHVMFTFWDGIDVSKKRPGGTSSALHFKLEGNTEEQTVSDMLTYTSVGPVVQFLTPRKNPENLKEPVKGLNVERLEQDKEVAVFYWSKHDLWDPKNKCYFFPDRERMTEENRCKKSVSSMKEIVETLERLGELNWYSINCPDKVKKSLSKSKSDLFDEKYLEELQSKLEDFCDDETTALIDHYAYVDSQAGWFKKWMQRFAIIYLVGVALFLICGALLSSLWEIHQNDWGHGTWFSFVHNGEGCWCEMLFAFPLPTIVYWVSIAVFLIGYGLALFLRYRIRFYRFRTIAEALRIQLFWRIAGMSDCVSGYYRSHQLPKTDWLRAAINGLDVLFAAPEDVNFNKTPSERLTFVREVWINGQLQFFQDRLAKGEPTYTNSRTEIWLIAVWLVSIVLFPFIPTWMEFLHARCALITECLQIAYGLLLVSLPIYGLYIFWNTIKHPQSELNRYKQMLFPFDRAILLLKSEPESKEPDVVFRQLGTEAIAENASWYLSMEERKLTLPR